MFSMGIERDQLHIIAQLYNVLKLKAVIKVFLRLNYLSKMISLHYTKNEVFH